MNARALALCLACGLSGCPSSDRPVAFPPAPPPPELARELLARDAERVKGFSPQGPAAGLSKLFRQANLLAVEQRDNPAAADGAQQDLRMAAKRAMEDQGQDSLVRVGLLELQEFERRLDALLSAAAQVDGSAGPLLTGSPPPAALKAAYHDFAELGGDFLLLAAANDLVRPGEGGRGLDMSPEGRFFTRLAFKVYWSSMAPEATQPLDWALSDVERLWYERWVAERSRTALRPRRLEAVRYLKSRDPAYPEAKAAGIILFQQRQYAEAAQAFQKALEQTPQDPDLPSFLEQAKRHAG
ncbi:MAG TPA: tetratricopeptide repeat protein [Myxococcota bacterium]|nr:tetratricopeptide repeat protein [Myxococcota bacterium]HRY91935.1 tetratricopeptide repeat protein [Myxococcota bacterium]HSA22280.1 tetratricopeptide repeat protein [Myxococcota bacterium]